MDKLCKFIDRELEDLESKAQSSGKLSSAEVNYGKDLAKFKMALLTNERMEQDGYSSEYDGTSYEGASYQRGGRGGGNRGGGSSRGMSGARGRGGRRRYSNEDGYSRADAREDFMEEAYELVEKAPDEHTKKKFERFLNEMQ